jgi:predicted NUDIX family NTP pyrophosphohydrolase
MRAPAKPKPVSAGLLLCRRAQGTWEFLLVHPGGPFFAKKDEGAWSIAKGLVDPNEDLLAAARREFAEETGFALNSERFLALGSVVQKGGTVVHAWACEGDCDPRALRSNTFRLEWPPKSGKMREVPEVDRAEFFGADEARRKLLAEQAPFVERALAALG